MILYDISMRSLVQLMTLPCRIHWLTNEEVNKCGSVCRCVFVSEQEAIDIENEQWDKDTLYNNDEIGIYLWDTTTVEFLSIFQKCDPGLINQMTSQIDQKVDYSAEEFPLVWAIYCILHEIGHFVEPKENICDYYINNRYQQKCAEEGLLNYKEIEAEKYADAYALSHLEETFDRIITNR